MSYRQFVRHKVEVGCFHQVCFGGLAVYSMYENFRHYYVEQTIKMCLVVCGVARNNTLDSRCGAEEITCVDVLRKDFFFSNYMHQFLSRENCRLVINMAGYTS